MIIELGLVSGVTKGGKGTFLESSIDGGRVCIPLSTGTNNY